MIGKPYQSCLKPYENEIVALRRKKPPMPYSQIAELLRNKYQVTVSRMAICKFLKVRARGFKPCKYAWAIEPADSISQPVVEVPSIVSPKQVSSIKQEVLEQPATEEPAKQETLEVKFEPFSEIKRSKDSNYYTPLPPEEVAAKKKIIEEKMRIKYGIKEKQ